MAKKFGGENKVQSKTAPPYPEVCQCVGCSNDTTIAIMRVLNKNTGKRETGSVGGHHKKSSYGFKSGDMINMNDQFDFLSWITRCGNCYQIELEQHGKRAIDNCRRTAREREDQAISNATKA